MRSANKLNIIAILTLFLGIGLGVYMDNPLVILLAAVVPFILVLAGGLYFVPKISKTGPATCKKLVSFVEIHVGLFMKVMLGTVCVLTLVVLMDLTSLINLAELIPLLYAIGFIASVASSGSEYPDLQVEF